MAGDTPLTIVGNLTADPELRFTPSGKAVANFTIASTPRKFNKNTNAWEDEEALFMRCTVWQEMAENVAESLAKGTAVIATGRLKQRSFETKEGEKRTVYEMDVDEVGPSVKWATAKVTKASRQGSGRSQAGPSTGGVQDGGDDPWAASGPAYGGSGSGNTGGSAGGWSDEPPF